MRLLRKAYTSALAALTPLAPSDPIHACGSSVTCLLADPATAALRANDLIRLAHDKLHAFPYRDVPLCWRRLYVDGCLWKALRVLERIESNGDIAGACRGENVREDGRTCREDWAAKVVGALDMALILAGGVGREDIIEGLLKGVAQTVEEEEEERIEECNHAVDNGDSPLQRMTQHSPRKRRKLGTFDKSLEVQQSAPHGNTAMSFNTTLRRIPRLDFPIRRSSNIDMLAFESHMHTHHTPLIITDSLNHWPALADPARQWKNPAYLLKRTIGGRRLVPIEVGRSYTDDGWGQKIITFRAFMERYLLARSHIDGEDADGDCEDGDDGNGEHSIGYLAQHDLFAQIPSLRADISIPDYCYTSPPPPLPIVSSPSSDPNPPTASQPPPLDTPLLNAWFGPAGTISPLHTDPYHNILCQVVGKKYIRLYAPEQGKRLYPRGVETGGVSMENTSAVDVSPFIECEDYCSNGYVRNDAGAERDGRRGKTREGEKRRREVEEEFPLFGGARYVEGILAEGECLYIPVGWWHYVEGLSTSFSVSFWWN